MHAAFVRLRPSFETVFIPGGGGARDTDLRGAAENGEGLPRIGVAGPGAAASARPPATAAAAAARRRVESGCALQAFCSDTTVVAVPPTPGGSPVTPSAVAAADICPEQRRRLWPAGSTGASLMITTMVVVFADRSTKT